MRSVWFNNSVSENASFSYATGLTDFNVTVNGAAVPSSWFDNAAGVIAGTTNVTGRYEFFDSACNQYGCVLGEFWVEDRSGWVDYNRHVYFAIHNGIFHTHKIDNTEYAHIDDDFASLNYTNPLKNLFYHKSDPYNDGQDAVITN